MIYYPIQTLVDAGIRDILIVTGGKNAGDFLRLLANGKHFGLKHIGYTYQEGEGGIADALALAEHFADGDKICVILGDNIIQGSIRGAVDQFRQQAAGARILLKKVPDAERFGVAEIAGNRIVNIEEKPKQPKSDFAVTGIYMYDATVFDKIKTLVPSGRGELEITDVNNAYIREGTMTFSFLGGLVDGRGHIRFAAARRQSGSAEPAPAARLRACWKRRTRRAWPAKRRRFPRPAESRARRSWSWRYRSARKESASVDREADSAAADRGGAHRSRSRYGRTTAVISSKCSALGRGLAADFPAATTQVSAAVNYPGTIKAFHYHLHQTDCWTPVAGLLQVALVDLRAGSATYGARNTLYTGALRPWQILIPPGVAHGYKVVGPEPALLVYLTDRFYDPADEGRIPYDDPHIQYDWETQHKWHRHSACALSPGKTHSRNACATYETAGHRRRRIHRLGVHPADAGVSGAAADRQSR